MTAHCGTKSSIARNMFSLYCLYMLMSIATLCRPCCSQIYEQLVTSKKQSVMENRKLDAFSVDLDEIDPANMPKKFMRNKKKFASTDNSAPGTSRKDKKLRRSKNQSSNQQMTNKRQEEEAPLIITTTERASSTIISSQTIFADNSANNINNNIVNSNINSANSNNIQSDKRKSRQCRLWKKQYQVVPGRSWGTLTKHQQEIWMNLQCDMLFCQPHALAGKGIYNCVPLQSSNMASNDNSNENIENDGNNVDTPNSDVKDLDPENNSNNNKNFVSNNAVNIMSENNNQDIIEMKE